MNVKDLINLLKAGNIHVEYSEYNEDDHLNVSEDHFFRAEEITNISINTSTSDYCLKNTPIDDLEVKSWFVTLELDIKSKKSYSYSVFITVR